MKKVALAISLLCSLYFCIGGLFAVNVNQKFKEAEEAAVDSVSDINGQRYRNLLELDAENDHKSLEATFIYLKALNTTMSLIITFIAFSLLGSITRIIKSMALNNARLEDFNIYALLILGILIGFISYILSMIVPDLANENTEYILLFLTAYLGGLFAEDFFRKLKDRYTANPSDEG